LGEGDQFFGRNGEISTPHTKMRPSGSPYGVGPRAGAGDASELEEELAPVTTDGGINTGVGVLRREPVDRDGDRPSMVVPSVFSPVRESVRDPVVVVSTER